MRELTIQQINELDHGEIIPSFRATIAKIYDQKTGEGEYGPWYLQNLIVTDGTDDISVTWCGFDPFDRGCRGQTFLFECHEGKKGLAGIKRDIREFNDKIYEGIKITDSARITNAKLNGKIEEGGERSPTAPSGILSGRTETHGRDDPPSSPAHTKKSPVQATEPRRSASNEARPAGINW